MLSSMCGVRPFDDVRVWQYGITQGVCELRVVTSLLLPYIYSWSVILEATDPNVWLMVAVAVLQGEL